MADTPNHSVVVTAHGGPDVLEVRDTPVPDPGPGQLLVRVAASGVNFIDVYRREGIYPTEPPFILGNECAGTVLALGSDVTGVSVGDRVATAESENGSHSNTVLVSAARAVPVPDGVELDTAAAAMLQGMTAHYLVTSVHAVAEADRVLVHAAAGGTGRLITQLAKARGAFVVGTVGSEAKEAVARAAGADAVVRYDTVSDADALASAVREAAGGGVHVAYDGVGQATFDASLGALRPRGMLAIFGAASGQVPPVDVQRLNGAGSVFLTRPKLFDYIAERDELLWRAGEVLAAVADGTLSIEIGGRYGLDDAAQAYRDLEGRRTTGKLLVVP